MHSPCVGWPATLPCLEIKLLRKISTNAQKHTFVHFGISLLVRGSPTTLGDTSLHKLSQATDMVTDKLRWEYGGLGLDGCAQPTRGSASQ